MMKRQIALLTALILTSLSLLSCASPAAQEEASPTPSPTPTATAAPSPSPDEPDYDSIELPEPKSGKWESYGRIVFYSFDAWIDPLDSDVRYEKGSVVSFCPETELGQERAYGCYPFGDNTNAFFAERINLEGDDMFYIDIQIKSDSYRKTVREAHEKKVAEAEKLLTADSREYIDGLRDCLSQGADALYGKDKHLDDSFFYFSRTTDDYYFKADFYLSAYRELEAQYDEQWLAAHGDLSAKEYFNGLADAQMYKHKAAYSLCRKEIDYLNSCGFDMYYYYNEDYDRYRILMNDPMDMGRYQMRSSKQTDGSDPRLRGFVRADVLEKIDELNVLSDDAVYFIYSADGFLTDYCGIRLTDLPDYTDERILIQSLEIYEPEYYDELLQQLQ